MVDKDTLSYKRGFAKGIEIYAQNLSKSGYDADEDNKKCVGAFKHYAETGFKKGIRLNDGQRQYFYGMADGIEYKYKQGGTPLIKEKKESILGWYGEKFSTYRKTWEDGKWYCIEDKYFDPGAWIVNIEYMKKYPEYKYSQCENPFIFNLFKYLRLYEQYPQMEYIMKMGLKRYVMSKMILRQCKDKTFRKWLYKNKERLTDFNKYYDVSVVLRAYKTGKTLDDLQTENEIIKRYSHDERLKSIRKNFRGELPKLYRYINSQKITTAIYRDYFTACEYLKLDMNVPKNRYPKEFMRWHDIRINEYDTAKIKADE